MTVTESQLADGLRALGCTGTSSVLVHASLRSFGPVLDGASAVVRALTGVCGTVLMVAGSWDRTGVSAPPGLIRPHNAALSAASWAEFDRELAAAVPFTNDLPVDGWLGRIAETMRRQTHHVRGCHPTFSFLATGTHAARLIAAQRPDWPLGPIEELANLDGDVLLLGVDHTVNTSIHLAEQRLGRSCFYRYAKAAPGVWMELPNISGESHRFDEIEPVLRPVTTEQPIGRCRARRVSVRDVLSHTTSMIEADPGALLCADPECRCYAAHQQRRAVLAGA